MAILQDEKLNYFCRIFYGKTPLIEFSVCFDSALDFRVSRLDTISGFAYTPPATLR